MSPLELMIKKAENEATFHARKCSEILEAEGLADALQYCSEQSIEPPQCSLTANSDNADRLRATATRMLSEVKWWKRRLKVQARQEFELEQMKQGKVTRYISDDSYEYWRAKK